MAERDVPADAGHDALTSLMRGHYTTGTDSPDAAWCKDGARATGCPICALLVVAEAAKKLADVSDYSYERKTLLAALGSLEPTRSGGPA